MTTQQHIKAYFAKNPADVRKLRVQRVCLQSKAFVVAGMVDALHAELVNMGSKAKMTYRQAAKLARCVDIENETYGWDRTVSEMAEFIITEAKQQAAA